jgi:hypothetical protein
MYIIVQDLELYRELHQLNRLLLQGGPTVSHRPAIPKDLSWLKADPMNQMRKEYEESAH